MRSVLRTVLVATLCFAIPIPKGVCQVNTATLTGVVTDTTGALIPNADVTLQNTNTGSVRTLKTNEAGHFAFQLVTIGPYTLNTSSTGYADKKEALVLVAGQQLDLPITLTVQTVSMEVVVTTDAALIDTSSSALSSSLTAGQVNSLPVARHDWTGLLQLGAGQGKTATAQTGGGAGAFATGLTINGLPSEGYNLTVDGTNATGNPEFISFSFYQAPNIINTVNNDAIQEVSLTKGVAPSTIGNTMSGGINIITKSGTNKIHGSVYALDELSVYDARNQFITARPRTVFNQFGGSLGGAILRDKLFGFISYEGARLSAAKIVSGAVPTPYLKSLSPAAYTAMYALFPAVAQPSNPTATTVQYTGTNKTKQTDGNGVARIDYNINSSNTLAVRYIRARPDLISPTILASNPRTTVGHTDAFNGTYTHIGKRWTENSRVGFNQLLLNRIDGAFASDLQSTGFGFTTSGIIGKFLQRGSYTTIEQAVAVVLGSHSLQMGGIFQRQNASRLQLQTSTLSYPNLTAFLNNAPSTATLRIYQLPNGTSAFGFTDYQYGGYLQDDWKVSKKLTLNLGLRYDVFTVPKEYQGRDFNRGIDPARPALGFGFGPFRPQNSIYDGDHTAIQPRLGLAYQPFDGKSTVIRASAGKLTAAHNLFAPINTVAPSATLPLNSVLTPTQTTAAGLKFPYDDTQYGNTIAQLQSSGQLSSNLAFISIDGHNPDPYSVQYQVGVEQGLPGTMALEINYVGTRGLREFFYEVRNQPDRITGVTPAANFSSFFAFTPGDRSHYDGLQTTLRRPMLHGLQFSASYTFARNRSYGNADLLQEAGPQDNNNVAAEWGPAPSDVRHRFVANTVYILPFDRLSSLKGLAGRLLLQGWQVSGIYSAQTGLPVNVYNPTSGSYPNDRPDAPTTSPYVSGFKQSSNHLYLLASAFPAVPAGAGGAQSRPGTLGRYALRAPGLWNVDASLAKTFNMEYVHLQLRMDTFNTLNHTNYSGLVAATNSTSTFGQLTTATARTMQVGARITF